MSDRKNRVCPVELAGGLDNRFRRWIQNPTKILAPYIKEGMIALDLGCGPGFFSIELAKLVGQTGKVIAADLQDGMLQKLRNKIQGTELEQRITLHLCQPDKIGVVDTVDFVLLFYMVHEIPEPHRLFSELSAIVKPEGRMLIIEPIFHVSNKMFKHTIQLTQTAGFIAIERPKVLFSKSVLLQKK
ncbi:MAG: class I SAM-dependent methyltransferase [bacterium]